MGRKLSNIFIFICIAVFIGAGIYLLKYFLANHKAESTLKAVAEERAEKGLAALYEQNPDIIGWIEVPGTRINYPVMQTPDDPEYYLHRDFNKNWSESGTPFLDAASCIKDATKVAIEPNTDEEYAGEDYADEEFISDETSTATSETGYATESTWNWLIYGHHMRIGTMFHDLMKFKEEEFWKKHKEFTFTHIKVNPDGSIDEVPVDFKIIGAAHGRVLPAESPKFKFYEYAGCYDQETYEEFVDGVKKAALYDIDSDPQFDDTICVLSTCSYRFGTSDHNDRFYLAGVRK